jgi:transcriptional regulator with XRE-family HTH domain
MTNEKKTVDILAEKFGDIAAELARARSNAGLSHSDLHRLTGISRSVLFGYENGRTKPGAREIRLLCDALKVTPNRLIYGSDDTPFEAGASPFPEWLEFDSQDYGTVNATMLMMMLSKEERSALFTLAYSILEARRGKQELEAAFQTVKVVGQTIGELDILSREKLNAVGETLEKKISKKTPSPKKLGK